jgi:hypothetical protein
MKILIRIVSAIALICIGFTAGVSVGQSKGFRTGSEWAFVQASLIARERGLFMPVKFSEGHFRILLRQPRGLRKRTRELAEKYSEDLANKGRSEKELAKNVRLDEDANLIR